MTVLGPNTMSTTESQQLEVNYACRSLTVLCFVLWCLYLVSLPTFSLVIENFREKCNSAVKKTNTTEAPLVCVAYRSDCMSLSSG